MAPTQGRDCQSGRPPRNREFLVDRIDYPCPDKGDGENDEASALLWLY